MRRVKNLPIWKFNMHCWLLDHIPLTCIAYILSKGAIDLKKNLNLYTIIRTQIQNNLAINFQMKSWDMLKWKYVTKYNDSSLKTRQNFFQHIYGKRDILKYAGTECKVRNLSSRGWRWLSDGDLPIYLPIDPSVLFRFLVFS